MCDISCPLTERVLVLALDVFREVRAQRVLARVALVAVVDRTEVDDLLSDVAVCVLAQVNVHARLGREASRAF